MKVTMYRVGLLFLFSALVMNLGVVADVAEDDGIEVDEPLPVPASTGDDAGGLEMLKPSPDGDSTVLFTKPTNTGLQQNLIAGKDVQVLVGFTNKGSSDFVLDTLDASFRYAMDFSFHLQNFSAIGYNRLVKPGEQASLFYSFLATEQFAGRPIGLNLNLIYHDAAGKYYQDAVFNKTIEIIELDEGLDGETFFLYVLMLAFVVLLLVVLQQFLSSMSRKSGTQTARPKVETGTQNGSNVAYEWLPSTVYNPNKSPKPSPRQSPRQRKKD